MVTEAHWQQWKTEDFQPYLDELLECFGPDRLMYGSDWPVCLLAGSYHQVKHLLDTLIRSLSAAEQQKILGTNAIRFYQLKV